MEEVSEPEPDEIIVDRENKPVEEEEAPQENPAELAEALCTKADCAFYGHGEAQSYEKAFELYKEAANSGSGRAYACMAKMYESGIFVEQNLDLAFECYQKGSELNDSSSLFALGKYYEKNIVPESVEKRGIEIAVEYYMKAQELGNHDAITKLGHMHENGIYFEKNLTVANQLYERAAELGNALAKNFVGLNHYNKKNYKFAVELFKKSKELGCARAANNLGMCYEQGTGVEKDPDKALECYQDAADKKYAPGMYNLAYLYLKKAKSTNQLAQFSKAAYWFRAALTEDPKMSDALFYLGFLYEKGLGVDRDYHTAYSYYRKAASFGHAKAWTKCGDLLYSGRGLLRADKKEAYFSYENGAKKGDPEAYNAIGLLYENGCECIEKNPAKAFENYNMAIKLGSVEALINLALMYINGIYVRKDIQEANRLMISAAEKGDTKAREYLVDNGVVSTIQHVKKPIEEELEQPKSALTHTMSEQQFKQNVEAEATGLNTEKPMQMTQEKLPSIDSPLRRMESPVREPEMESHKEPSPALQPENHVELKQQVESEYMLADAPEIENNQNPENLENQENIPTPKSGLNEEIEKVEEIPEPYSQPKQPVEPASDDFDITEEKSSAQKEKEARQKALEEPVELQKSSKRDLENSPYEDEKYLEHYGKILQNQNKDEENETLSNKKPSIVNSAQKDLPPQITASEKKSIKNKASPDADIEEMNGILNENKENSSAHNLSKISMGSAGLEAKQVEDADVNLQLA